MDAILTILKLIPALVIAIKAVEDAVPGAGKGEQKLAAVRGILEALDGAVATLWPRIAVVITEIVDLLNKTGEFKK